MINNIGQMKLDELIASGKAPAFTKTIKLASGTGALKRGQLIGVSSTGVYSSIKSSDEPYGILCNDVTLSSGEVSAVVYVSGHFNGNAVIGYSEADHYDALRGLGIYVENAIEY